MKDEKQFADSKDDDENFILPMLNKWKPGKRTPFGRWCTLDGCWADLHGCDIYEVNPFNFCMHMTDSDGRILQHQKLYDTKYMKADHVWFVTRKIRPDDTEVDVITTDYIYVFDDYVLMFERDRAIKYVKEKGYEMKIGDPDPDTGIYAEYCIIPKQDFMMMGINVVPKWAWEEFKPLMKNKCARWER